MTQIAKLLTTNQQSRNQITVVRDRLEYIKRIPNEEQRALAMAELFENLEQLINDSAAVISAKRTFKINPKNEPEGKAVRVTFVVNTTNARAVKELVKAAFELNFYPNCKKTSVANISLIRVYETDLQYGMQFKDAYPEMILQVYAGKDEGNLDLTAFAPMTADEKVAADEAEEMDAMVEPTATPAIEDAEDDEVEVEDDTDLESLAE